MAEPLAAQSRPSVPTFSATLELLKPLTWFAPMWAFGCGVVSSGASFGDRWPYVVGGILLAGPLVCGTSGGEATSKCCTYWRPRSSFR